MDAVHRGTAVVEGRKPRLYALGEAERRLRQRVEPTELLSREFDVERLQVVLELCEPSRADDCRGHAGLRLNPGQRDSRDRALLRLGDDAQLVQDRVGLLGEDGVRDEAAIWLDLAGVVSRVFAAEYAALEGRPRRNADAELASHRHELLLDGPLEQRVLALQPDERGPATEARRD